MSIELFPTIDYETLDVGYFVTMNDIDCGGEDYCKMCIKEAVNKERNYHKSKRAEIVSKFNEIETTGFFKGNNVKQKYTEAQIKKAKREELKEYPAKALFKFRGHDPDFSGGSHSPLSCNNCGEYFTCSFTADEEEANYLLSIVTGDADLSERDKWEIDAAFYTYDSCTEKVKKILDVVKQCIIQRIP